MILIITVAYTDWTRTASEFLSEAFSQAHTMPGTQDSINKCELPSERLRLRAVPLEGANPDLTVTEKTSNVIQSLEAAPTLGLRLPDSALLSQTLHRLARICLCSLKRADRLLGGHTVLHGDRSAPEPPKGPCSLRITGQQPPNHVRFWQDPSLLHQYPK